MQRLRERNHCELVACLDIDLDNFFKHSATILSGIALTFSVYQQCKYTWLFLVKKLRGFHNFTGAYVKSSYASNYEF